MIASATGHHTDPFVQLMACLIVILVLGRIVAAGCRRIGFPTVIGEILAGIALGPSLLGRFSDGDWQRALFPTEVIPYLKLVAQLGLVLFMFVVGLEVDMDVIRSSGRRAIAISLTSIALPFLLGFTLLGPMLHADQNCVVVSQKTFDEQGVTPEDSCQSQELAKKQAAIDKRKADLVDDGNQAAADEIGNVAGKQVDFVPFAMFLGVSMCGTAFAVLARILAERQMFKIPLGILLVACAAIDDIVAFTLLAFSTAIASGSGIDRVGLMLLQLVLFVAALILLVRPVLDWLVVRKYRATGRLGPEGLSILFIGLLASSYVTSKIGVHELIGAFLFGVIVPRRNATGLFHAIAGKLDGVSVQLLLPVFFVVAGQAVNVTLLNRDDIWPIIAILLVACIGKFVGATVAARATGVPKRQSYAIGTLMNTRGLAELVILAVGRDAGVINDSVYTMLVFMAIVTTAMAGPLLKVVYPDRWLRRDIAEAERSGTGPVSDRALVVVGNPDEAEPLVDMAVAFGGARPTSSVTLVRFVNRDAGLAAMADALGETESLRKRVEDQGLSCTVVSRASVDPVGDTVAEIERLAPDAVIMSPGMPALVRPVTDGGVDVIVVDRPVDVSNGVTAPGGGGNDDRAALELATRLALHHDVTLDVHGAGSRITRQLKTLGVRGGTGGVSIGNDGSPVEVHAGARDRISLTERLGRWRVGDVVEPLTSI